ncbi:MAG: DUF4062 domain-containing protein [bacterium]
MATSNIWQTYSVFISSTFADMQIERDYLKNEIFPRIDIELRERRIKLDVVDLRWGVDTTSLQQEDEREATVLKVCLNEIKQSKPFFIGLLGDRYGWVPKEERMRKAIEENGADIKPDGKSVTALEIEFGVLASKEQLKRSFFYFRKPFDYTKLPEEKRGMFCDEYNNELTPAEKAERKTALYKLKTDIRAHFKNAGTPDKVKEYSIDWGKSTKENVGLIEWGEEVFKDILKDAAQYAKDIWDKVPKTWEEREHSLLGEFVNDHIFGFCGRTELLSELKQHLLSGSSKNWGLVLTGESGSGKSSVFAKIYDDLVEKKGDYFILAHSAGISPRSKNVADLLQIWIRQLWNFLEYQGDPLEEFEQKETSQFDKLGFGEQEKPKLKIDELQNKFTGLLFQASEKKRVIILIDALDRFEPTARAEYMSWFPTIVPQNLRMLCTAITGTEKNAVEYHKGLTVKSIDNFSPEEANDMLDTLCSLGHKKLFGKVTETILAKKRGDNTYASSSPLWLSLAVNIMMALDKDDFEKMSKVEGRADAGMESYMAKMIEKFPPLPGDLFINLINKACILFGEDFTNAVFNLIAISRNGLREKDLEKLAPYWEPLQYAALRRWFRAHLIKQSEELQWNLAHSILRNTLIDKIEKDNYKKLNDAIAAHLLQQPNTDALHISETMYHLMEADNKQSAAEYYGSELSEEEVAGATKVLVEAIIINKDKKPNPYLERTTEVFTKPVLDYTIQRKVGERIQFPLYESLEKEGNIEERTILLQMILPIQKKFYDDNPGELWRTYDLAISYSKLGELFKTMGQLDKALDFFEKVTFLFEELYKTNPNKGELKNGLAISYGNLGDLFKTMGQLDKALDFFEKRSKLGEELDKANPNNESLKNGLAISYHRIGSANQSLGKLKDALNFFEEYRQLMEEVFKNNPNSEKAKNDLAISYTCLGDLFKTMGQLDKALDFFEKRSKLGEELYNTNPKNELLKNGLAISYMKLGEVFQTMGQLDKTLDFFEKYRQFNEEFYKANSTNELHKNSLAISYVKLGEVFQTMGQLDKALDFFEKYRQFNEELYKANPKNIYLFEGLGISYYKLGVIYIFLNRKNEAKEFLLKYRDIYQYLFTNTKIPKYSQGLNYLKNKYGIGADTVFTDEEIDLEQEDIEYTPPSNTYSFQQPPKPPEEINLQELRELAEKSFNKGNWEAAETLYRKLEIQGEPFENVAPKLFACILNKRTKPMDEDIPKLNEILNKLESLGKKELAGDLRKQFVEMMTPPKNEKKGWKFWGN